MQIRRCFFFNIFLRLIIGQRRLPVARAGNVSDATLLTTARPRKEETNKFLASQEKLLVKSVKM